MTAAAAAHKRRQGARTGAGGGGDTDRGAVDPFSYAVVYHSRLTDAPAAASSGAATGGGPAAAGGGDGGGASCTAARVAFSPEAKSEGPAVAQFDKTLNSGEQAPQASPAASQPPLQLPSKQQDAEASSESGGKADGKGDGGGAEPLSDRGRIISLVAGGMAAAFGPAASVNLKKPDVAVLVDAVPVAGRQFVGVAMLPQRMMALRGRLGVKPLAKKAPAR